ncbi:MAG: DUF6782 family putative metallopeptidase [Pseudomonadota bacterium]
MKSNRFFPLSKPRGVTRLYDVSQADIDTNVEVMDNIEEAPEGFERYDLTSVEAYTISELKPLTIKKFKTLSSLPYAFKQDRDVLVWLAAMMTESPTGYHLITSAQDYGWKIALSDLGTGGFHLNIDEKVIEIDHFGFDPTTLGQSAYYRLSLLPILSKALRDINHEESFGDFESHYNPESVVQMERVRAADTDCISILVGWEFRANGYEEAWRHILASDDGDMAQVLINILERYPTALYNGMALAHVFRQWYADTNRIDAIDHDTLERLDAILTTGLDIFGHRDMKVRDVEMISLLPDGTKYLNELGDTVCSDPFFRAINDPINEAHLSQVVYDAQVTYAGNIPFQDGNLARKFS